MPLGQIMDSLHKEFDSTDLGALNYFLGISATRHSTCLFLCQKKYALQLLERAHMVHCNPSQTLVDTESKLGPDGVPVQDPTLYRSLAGGLQYLTFTRPDLSYVVQQIFLYMHDPREPHFSALKCILRYVKGTLDFGFHLYASATTSLVGYTDADWAGCPSTRRSTSGYCIFLGDNLLSWSSKRQHMISRSSAESEYRGVANVIVEKAWLRNLLRELHSPLMTATLVYCDNLNVVYMSANPVQHQQMKHIEIDINFVRDMVTTGQELIKPSNTMKLIKLINSQISVNNKFGVDFDTQMNENELHDCHLNKSEVFKSASDSIVNEIKEENNPVNDRFKKVKGYHVVPPPYTGNYMPLRPDLSFARLDDSVYKTTVSETISSVPRIESIASKSSKDSLE
ncbi:ribonuclease H-like domain-containing protein [Tanacetum coccineum]